MRDRYWESYNKAVKIFQAENWIVMKNIWLSIIVIILKIVMLFVTKKRYERKVDNINGEDKKLSDYDIDGWKYKEVHSQDGKYIHRYYYYPCVKENAPIFIMFHGLIFNGMTFLYYTELASSYTLIAYDFPEKSDAYTGEISDFKKMIDDFISTMYFKSVSLVGVSFGGIFSLYYTAQDKSGIVDNIILISTPVAGVNKMMLRRSIMLDNLVRSLPDYKLYWFIEAAVSRFINKFSEENQKKIKTITKMKHIQYYRQIASAMRGYCANNDARKIHNPVLIVLGTKDFLVSNNEKRHFKKLIPHAQIQIVKGGTHVIGFLNGDSIAKQIHLFCSNVHKY